MMDLPSRLYAKTLRFVTAILFALILLSLGQIHNAHASVAPVNNWHKLTSKHIHLYTDYDLDTARDFLHRLRIFRSVILQFMKGVEKPNAQPLSVFIFENQTMWSRVRGYTPTLGGYFTHPVYGPLAAVGPQNQGTPNLEIIFHEYTHYLVDVHVPVAYPKWYNEGMAEFFSTVAIEENYVYIGAVPKRNVKLLENYGLLSPSVLFDNAKLGKMSSQSKGKFYPSAWLTAHYFTLGARNGFPSYYKNNAAFLQKLREGEDIQDAFEQTFPISMRELDRELRRYARSTRKDGFAIDRPALTDDIVVQKLASHQAQAKLATVFGWRDKEGMGYAYLNAAAQHNEPFALSVLAMHAATQGDVKISQGYLDRLPEQDSLPANVLHNIAAVQRILAKRAAEQGNELEVTQRLDLSDDALSLNLTKSPYMPSLLMQVQIALQQSKTSSDNSQTQHAIDALLTSFGYHFEAQVMAAEAFIGIGDASSAINSINKAFDRVPHNRANADYIGQLVARLNRLVEKLKQ